MTSNQATQPTMVSSGEQPQDASSGRILLAEDNSGCQKLVICILTKAGYEVDLAENGQQVVEKVQQNPYDLILMDMQMPMMDGLTTTKTIRNLGYQNIPILGLTANAFQQDREQCISAGMNEHISKPVSPAKLIDTIGYWLGRDVNATSYTVGETCPNDTINQSPSPVETVCPEDNQGIRSHGQGLVAEDCPVHQNHLRNLVERSGDAEIKRQHDHVSSNSTLTSLLETMPHIVMILNRNRQIVWANHCLLVALHKDKMEELVGIRPGEVFQCVNAIRAEHGCGTAKECQTCGALLAILQSLDENGSEKECTILTTNNDALNLRIKAGLIEVGGEVFDCVSIVDISDEKTKRILEHLFFHDIMNLAGSIQGFANLIPDLIREKADQLSDILPVLSQGADDLIELIKSQKDLLSAEINELTVYNKTIDAQELLHSIRGLLERNDLLQGRQIKIHDTAEKVIFSSDERILKRVISNAVKNALEAVKEEDTIHLRYKRDGAGIVFEIQNSSYMPEDVQSRIFRKSFSTKGRDRGIGTYSIKLFTEKYLNGKVWFISRKGEGTTFYIQIPA